ncbi:MAG: hypothetical protein N2645_19125 [Clostridia bacterium]|nr:hypothetical protein [Clostridia bacterium]
MGLGKKEVRLIAVLGILLYAFAFYKLVWVDTWPTIKEKNEELKAAEEKRDKLDAELKNIESMKIAIKAKNVANERLNEYLADHENPITSMDYLDKLRALIGSDIKKVVVNKPGKRTIVDPLENATTNNQSSSGTGTNQSSSQSGKDFYEIKIDFDTVLTYDKVVELIRFVEGGARKVNITRLSLASQKDILNNPNAQAPAANGAVQNTRPAANTVLPNFPTTPVQGQNTAVSNMKFDIQMTLNLYALSDLAANDILDYTNSKFNTYQERKDIPFAKPER